MFPSAKVKKLKGDSLLEAFGTGGAEYAYTKEKAYAYMTKAGHEYNVILVKEPKNKIEKPRVVIRIGKSLISFSCDKIYQKYCEGFHILTNDKEI